VRLCRVKFTFLKLQPIPLIVGIRFPAVADLLTPITKKASPSNYRGVKGAWEIQTELTWHDISMQAECWSSLGVDNALAGGTLSASGISQGLLDRANWLMIYTGALVHTKAVL